MSEEFIHEATRDGTNARAFLVNFSVFAWMNSSRPRA